MGTCETCTAWARKDKNPADNLDVGECHANPPILLNFWNGPQGSGWQAGFPPVISTGWCRAYQEKKGLSVVK